MQEILIVDDERILREGLKSRLVGEGYSVRTARDGEEALRKIAERRPALVLLDVMMPKMNGFLCCEKIREADALLPVIFLTAKVTEADQVRGIGLGADDYVSKEAGDAVLLARISRAIRRTQEHAEVRSAVGGAELRLGRVTVDLNGLTVCEGKTEISRLTRTEADVLRLFAARRGEFLVIDDIITELRGNGFACEDQMVYSHIGNLRRKLGSASKRIVNRHGVGYGLVD